MKLQIESLADMDKTIDDLFLIYQAEGRTDLFEEMCPYFGTLWPAGRVLAHYLSEQPSSSMIERLLKNQGRVLEVGCGLAVPSLYFAKRGFAVQATDVHPDVPLFLARNREHNKTVGPEFLSLDWRLPQGGGPKWDLVLASDVLYDKTQPATLLRFLKEALIPGGIALVADPGRSYVQGFFHDATQQGFKIKTHGLFGVLIGELTRDVVS